MSTVRSASSVNAELTKHLVEAGGGAGLTPVTEYAVPGGRVDVVWLWNPPIEVPGVAAPLPVVGFEIESSWRTRKHVKGDLLNLQDAGVALGVIVLAGVERRDESLRRFASLLVERPGAPILIWTEAEVRALADGGVGRLVAELATASESDQPALGVPVEHRGRHRGLWEWLGRQEPREIRIGFSELERVARVQLPRSCRDHVTHWHSYDGSAVARAIIDAGWHASRVDLNAQVASLVPGPRPNRP